MIPMINRSLVLMAVMSAIHFVNAEFKYSESSNTKWQQIQPSEVERLYNNSFMSDIIFTFGNKKPGEVFYAHKHVLALCSPLFYEMFYRSTEKATKDIHLPDYSNANLARFIGVIYKDDCPTDLEKDIELVELMMKYQIARLPRDCKNFLQQNTESEKAYRLVEKFIEQKTQAFAEICFDIIDALAEKYFASEHFLNIKQSTLNILLSRETLYYDETKIFEAVLKWADHQCLEQNLEKTGENRRKVVGNAIYSIRFLLMNQNEFVSIVTPTDILYNNETGAIIKAMTGKHVPNLAWDSIKLRSKRLPKKYHEEIKASAFAKESNSLVYIIGVYINAILTFITGIIVGCCCSGWMAHKEKLKRQ